MKKLIKNWILRFIFLFLFLCAIIFILIILNFRNLHVYLFILFGIIISSVLFFIFGFLFNKKIVNKILRLNSIVKNFLPKKII